MRVAIFSLCLITLILEAQGARSRRWNVRCNHKQVQNCPYRIKHECRIYARVVCAKIKNIIRRRVRNTPCHKLKSPVLKALCQMSRSNYRAI